MKKHHTTAILMVFALVAASVTHAESYSDDFQRPTTSGQDKDSTPNAIGTQYTILSGKWNISDTATAGRRANNLAAAQATGDPASIMYFNKFQTLRNDGNQFSVSADVWSGGTGTNLRWQGLVFNLQDVNNYYIFDYEVRAANSGVVRLGIVSDGVYTQIVAQSGVNVNTSIYYRMTVTADANGITATLQTETTELATLSSTNTALLDGYAGFIRNSTASTSFDDFEVIVIPEPSTVALMLGVATLGMLYTTRSKRKRTAPRL